MFIRILLISCMTNILFLFVVLVGSLFQFAGASHILANQNHSVILVTGDKITGSNILVPFYVASVHYKHIIRHEQGPLGVAMRALQGKAPNCIAIDVGMSDGFYTQFSAAYGCSVWAFELQSRCIEIARHVTEMNNYNDRVTIIHQPVSDRHNANVMIPHGHDQLSHEKICDGGFSFTGEHPEKVAHVKYELTGKKAIRSIALQHFFPRSTIINFLKIDVEGHEVEVLRGAEIWFKEHRVKHVVVEIAPFSWNSQVDFTTQYSIFENILSYEYNFRCVNIHAAENKFKSVYKTVKDMSSLKDAMTSGECVDWEIFLE